jgi:hypothetical protein
VDELDHSDLSVEDRAALFCGHQQHLMADCAGASSITPEIYQL